MGGWRGWSEKVPKRYPNEPPWGSGGARKGAREGTFSDPPICDPPSKPRPGAGVVEDDHWRGSMPPTDLSI
eukprot:3331464-Pyramimonas_sp.AAC.3